MAGLRDNKAGVEKLETDAANLQNGVAQVKGVLPGWNKGKGGRSSLAGVIDVANKVADIAQANGNTAAPAADAVKSPAPEAQVTQPSGVAQSGSVLSGAVDAGKKLSTIAQQPSAASPGPTARQELRQRQNAEINAENAKKAEEAVKREEADKSLANGGQPQLGETQLRQEKNANPQSSETGNGRDGVTAQNTDTANAAGASDPKFTTGGSAGMNTVSDEDYTSAQQRIADAKKSGKIPEQQDEETVWLHDNPRPVQPEMPALEEFTESQPPKLKDIDDSYRTAYAIMEQRMKAAGDDPASKAKRAKARRAQTIVAALGDLLQAAANMWGAAGGATSAKLSSVTAGVGRRHATEDAAELKREAQRAKDLEQMVRRGEKLTEAENKWIMELWKAGEEARKYNISEKNKNLRAKYQSELQAVRQYNAQIARDRHQVQVQHDREVTDLNRHNYRMTEATHRGNISQKNNDHATANRIKAKEAKGAGRSGSSGKDDTPA